MTRIRYALALVVAVALTNDVSAQYVLGVPAGIGFRYQSGGLRVGGFIGPGYYGASPYYGYGPYYYPSYPFPPLGLVQQRVSVQVMAPPVVIVRRAAGPDLSGIDLDVEPASKIWGDKPSLAKKSEPLREGARVEPPPERKAPPMPPVPAAKPEPAPKARSLTELGTEAFRTGDYNVAIRHFRQLAERSPLIARPLFLEAQALIAVGKYRAAVEIIERGLKRHPEWPSNAYRPRAELFDNDEARWDAQGKHIEEAHRRDPKNADYRFLLGYLAWFDGQREAAVEHFQEARALAPDAGWSDLFLKVAKK